MAGLGIGSLKRSIASYGRQSQDRTPENYLTPFQRADLMGRVQSMGEIQRSQAEDAIARRTRDTSGMAYQQQMAKLNEGTAGAVGTNVADIEMKDLQMGAQAKQQRLANLANQIQMKQQWTQMKMQQKAMEDAKQAAEPKESASDKFLGKYTLGGKLIKKMGMSPTQTMMMAAGAAAGGPMGAGVGSQMGAQLNNMQTGQQTAPSSGFSMGSTGAGVLSPASIKADGMPAMFGGTTYSQAPNMSMSTGVSPEAMSMGYGQIYTNMAPGFYGI